MRYKAIVYKPNGMCVSNAFPLLRNAKKYARQTSDPGDRVKIEEHWEDEQSTVYEYEVEDWNDKAK